MCILEIISPIITILTDPRLYFKHTAKQPIEYHIYVDYKGPPLCIPNFATVWTHINHQHQAIVVCWSQSFEWITFTHITIWLCTSLYIHTPSKTHCTETWDNYTDVIMGAIASQITSLTIVYSTVYSDADQRKHQSSASLAFVWGIHRDRWIPRTNGQ